MGTGREKGEEGKRRGKEGRGRASPTQYFGLEPSLVIGVSRPPVLDCGNGTTFHPDYGGRDLPSTPLDSL